MKIHRLTAFQVPIALKRPVRHASFERSRNETLIVRCVLNDGSVGWGEGLPRTYVTGESIDSAWRHLITTAFSECLSAPFDTAAEIGERFDGFPLAQIQPDPGVSVRECFGNSVRCAVELSLLDAVCRSEGISLGELICRLPSAKDFACPVPEVRYSGAITAELPRKQWISAFKMRLFGFRAVKVKVGTSDISDSDCLKRVRRVLGRNVDIRLDANEAWQCDEVPGRILPLLPYHPTSLEQPVPHSEVSGLAHVRSRISVPVMLDESLCCLEDAHRAVAGGWCDLFNIRLSKCGGLFRSLALIAFARQHNIGYQLGCQVGETGILSAAGRHLACHIPDIRYLEGSFDRFLVRDPLTEQDLTFGYGGRAGRLAGPGLGVDVNECRVRQLATRSQDLFVRD